MRRVQSYFLNFAEGDRITVNLPGSPQFLKARLDEVSGYVTTWWIEYPESPVVATEIFRVFGNSELPDEDFDYLDTLYYDIHTPVHLFKKIVNFGDLKIVDGVFVPKSTI